MKFLGQGFEKVEPKQDRQTQTNVTEYIIIPSHRVAFMDGNH